MWSILLGWVFGLLQGARHAFEPDHLAAVSTIVAEQRSGRASFVYAAAWGAGHALMLLSVGGLLFLLRAEIPSRLAEGFELVVAVMLVMLGLRALRRAIAAGRGGRTNAHTHGPVVHAHGGVSDHVHVRRWTLARRPLLIGIVHGLAGSGGLAALAVSSFASAWSGILFLALYGFGAMLGMAALAGVAGVPLARLVRRPAFMPIVMGTAGGCSFVLGLVWGFPIVSRWLGG